LVKDADGADELVLFDHRYDEQCPDAAEFNPCNRQRIAIDVGLIGTKIGNVDGLARFGEPAHWVERPRPMRSAPKEVRERRGYAELRDDSGGAILEPPQIPEMGGANARRIFQNGLEHGLQFAWRTTDDLEHLRRRTVLLQRHVDLARAPLHLVEQAHVLDRDHRLVGEGGDEFDLSVAERLNLRARQCQHAYWTALA